MKIARLLGAGLGCLLAILSVGFLTEYAGAAPGKGVGCSLAPYAPGVMAVTVTGILTQPGYVTGVQVNGPNGGFGLIFFGKLPKGAPTTGTGYISYSTPGIYSADLYAINDKTGNGSGDGSGDQYTLLAAGACPAVLP